MRSSAVASSIATDRSAARRVGATWQRLVAVVVVTSVAAPTTARGRPQAARCRHPHGDLAPGTLERPPRMPLVLRREGDAHARGDRRLRAAVGSHLTPQRAHRIDALTFRGVHPPLDRRGAERHRRRGGGVLPRLRSERGDRTAHPATRRGRRGQQLTHDRESHPRPPIWNPRTVLVFHPFCSLRRTREGPYSSGPRASSGVLCGL